MKTKKIIRILLILIIAFIAYAMFSDWDNFKAGLSGGMPIKKEIRK